MTPFLAWLSATALGIALLMLGAYLAWMGCNLVLNSIVTDAATFHDGPPTA